MLLECNAPEVLRATSYPEIHHVFQHMVGSLLYAAITTRPDIAHAVQALSQFNTNPGPVHLTAVKRVFRYLCGTINLGIEYRSDPVTVTAQTLVIR
jgi:hypothetical protein